MAKEKGYQDIFGENYILTMRNMAIDLISEIISSNQFICLISKCEFSIIIENSHLEIKQINWLEEIISEIKSIAILRIVKI